MNNINWLSQIPPGWHALVQPLIDRCAQEGVSIDQVKQKFGGLRFYVRSCSDEFHAAINAAEKRSFIICEECGKPGRLRDDRSYIRALCDPHARRSNGSQIMKPRLFLDIDGVLNHNMSYIVFDYPRLFAPQCQLLEEICQATACEIVLVTNWRHIVSVEVIERHLRQAGITAPVIGGTPICNTRGDGVWQFGHQAYVILDDLADYAPDQHLILTDPHTGLKPEEAQVAIQILLN